MVSEFTKSATFPISYYYQENRGKYVALEKLYSLAQGEFCFQIDDDDELLPDAIEKGLAIWEKIPDKEQYWCVCGRCIDGRSREPVGVKFPKGINQFQKLKKRKTLRKITGEKCAFQRTEIVKKYRFPLLEECHFIPEGVLWKQINQDYDQFYTNTVFRVYHQFERESLSSVKTDPRSLKNLFFVYKYMLSVPYQRPEILREYFVMLFFMALAIIKCPELSVFTQSIGFIDNTIISLSIPLVKIISLRKGWLSKPTQRNIDKTDIYIK